MRTYSHFLMTAVLAERLKARSVPVHAPAFLLGAVMPDVPLLSLTLGFIVRRTWAGLPAAADPICGPRFNHLYFHNPFWQAGHGLFHAPLLIGLLTWIGYRFGVGHHKKWGVFLFWFSLACGFHTLVDTVTHHDDGPLLLFPLNWSYRFPAPLSYWDPQRGGKIFTRVERLLGLAMVIYLASAWLLRR